MLKFFGFLIGLLLVPCCVVVSLMVVDLVGTIQPDHVGTISPSAWALCGGFLLWVFLYFTLPRPARSYVLAHELTHAIWGLLMGTKVSRIRVSKEKGSVTLSKTNFLINLAPYFFPLYTVLVILGYYILAIFFPVDEFSIVWLGLVGFSWGFHLTFTISTLLQHQSDVRECGMLFSYTLTYLFNVMGIGLWIVLISDAELEQMVKLCGSHGVTVFTNVWHWLGLLWTAARETVQKNP